MSGLREMGGPFNPGDGRAVSISELDLLELVAVDSPSVSNTWFGTCNGGTAASGPAIGRLNQYADWPRNMQYSCAGVSGGTFGGTFTVNVKDQFGSAVTETVVVPSAAGGGSVYGTVIVSQFISGTFTSQGSSGGSTGTAQLGVGTVSNGGSQSNWFGLLARLGGTNDVKAITWITTNTPTGLNKGTNFGTLVGYNNNGSVPSNAFQGTSGVAATDHYRVLYKPSYDNNFHGSMIQY